MNGKDLEKHCQLRMEQEEQAGRAMMVRYGTQGSFRNAETVDLSPFVQRIAIAPPRAIEGVLRDLVTVAQRVAGGYQPQQSLPDFTGVVMPKGRAFDFDCKVCNAPSFPLDKESKSRSRQLRYMLKRARFGAVCFYLIHFPARTLTHTADPEQTWAFPIHPEANFWQAFNRGEVKRITRADCAEYAVPVIWNVLKGGRTPRPDVLAAVYELMGRLPNSALPSAPSIDPAVVRQQPARTLSDRRGSASTTAEPASSVVPRRRQHQEATVAGSRKSPRRAG